MSGAFGMEVLTDGWKEASVSGQKTRSYTAGRKIGFGRYASCTISLFQALGCSPHSNDSSQALSRAASRVLFFLDCLELRFCKAINTVVRTGRDFNRGVTCNSKRGIFPPHYLDFILDFRKKYKTHSSFSSPDSPFLQRFTSIASNPTSYNS